MNTNHFDQNQDSPYTSLERQSLYQILCATMIIDGEQDPRELALISKINRILGITTADIEASRRLSEPEMTQCLRNMDFAKKAYLGKFIAQVILADGKITPIEERFFYAAKQKLSLPDVD